MEVSRLVGGHTARKWGSQAANNYTIVTWALTEDLGSGNVTW